MKVPNKLQLNQNSELETKHLKVSWREVSFDDEYRENSK